MVRTPNTALIRPPFVDCCEGSGRAFRKCCRTGQRHTAGTNPSPSASGPLRRLGDVAKAAVQHACTECGYSAGRWFGKCPGCGSFGTLVEEPAAGSGGAVAKPLLRLVGVEAQITERIATRGAELDPGLGGGVGAAARLLVGGEPRGGQAA